MSEKPKYEPPSVAAHSASTQLLVDMIVAAISQSEPEETRHRVTVEILRDLAQRLDDRGDHEDAKIARLKIQELNAKAGL